MAFAEVIAVIAAPAAVVEMDVIAVSLTARVLGRLPANCRGTQEAGMPRPFRFAVNMLTFDSGQDFRARCRLAEQRGYDTILVPDHLGMPAPFSALVAAAQVTERPRLGTFVLNAGFWNPALLAREAATCDQLTGGRLELGLGAGYVKAEHDAAGLPFASPADGSTTWSTPSRRSSGCWPTRSRGPGRSRSGCRSSSAATASACWTWRRGRRTSWASPAPGRHPGSPRGRWC